MNSYPKCKRCGGTQYRDISLSTSIELVCHACGHRTYIERRPRPIPTDAEREVPSPEPEPEPKPEPPPDPRGIRLSEAAHEVGLSDARLSQLAIAGRLQGAVQDGRKWYIPTPVVILPSPNRIGRRPLQAEEPDPEPEPPEGPLERWKLALRLSTLLTIAIHDRQRGLMQSLQKQLAETEEREMPGTKDQPDNGIVVTIEIRPKTLTELFGALGGAKGQTGVQFLEGYGLSSNSAMRMFRLELLYHDVLLRIVDDYGLASGEVFALMRAQPRHIQGNTKSK